MENKTLGVRKKKNVGVGNGLRAQQLFHQKPIVVRGTDIQGEEHLMKFGRTPTVACFRQPLTGTGSDSYDYIVVI